VLSVPRNRIKTVIGPFNDLRDKSYEESLRNVMSLKVLDLRHNMHKSLPRASRFLRHTVVASWGTASKARVAEDEWKDELDNNAN